MPFGKILTWDEYLDGKESVEVTLQSPPSCVEDLKDSLESEDLVVVTHRLEDGRFVHGTLVIENSEATKGMLLEVRANKIVNAIVKNRVSSEQSFLNISVIATEQKTQ